ncbi:ER degradation-enhancing alpha-mannosidase-like protein 3 [Geodia barretti]|nr:ER degradation-enhancing alpha-mannosidase-like protein 3 [Geodia barretti]
MGIVIQAMSDGRVQISHTMQLARNQEDAEEGWYLMQEIIKAMDAQRAMGGGGGGGGGTREAKQVWILSPDVEDDKIAVGPALFGPDLGGDKDYQVAAGLVILEESSKACSTLPGDLGLSGKIVLIPRGGCLFVQKVREAQKMGAVGVIIEDNVLTDHNADSLPQTFSMSGDTTSGDIQIPSVFMLAEDGARLRDVAATSYGEEVFVLLTWTRKKGEEGGEEEEGEEEGGGGSG